MKIRSLFQNMTIKQADIFTIIVIFLLSMVFVALFVDEMYQDYERALQSSSLINNEKLLNPELIEENKKKLKSLLVRTALAVVTLSFIIFAIFLGINNIFNKFLQRDTQTF